jgi:hypothetical protein
MLSSACAKRKGGADVRFGALLTAMIHLPDERYGWV